ncbi:hypothetical protein LTR95_011223, partial [Oleoguttula sp. CCFEE 5521]
IAAGPAPNAASDGRRAETPRSAPIRQGPFTNEPWFRSIAEHAVVNGHIDARHVPVKSSTEDMIRSNKNFQEDRSQPRQTDGTRHTVQSRTDSHGANSCNATGGTEGRVNGHAQDSDNIEDEERGGEGAGDDGLEDAEQAR